MNDMKTKVRNAFIAGIVSGVAFTATIFWAYVLL